MTPPTAETDLVRLLLSRRSCRSFGAERIPEADLDAIEAALDSAPSVGGLGSGGARLVRDPGRSSEIVDALLTGLVGKINLWLARGPRPPALVICTGDPAISPVSEGRYLYNVDASLSGEAAVIAAAGRGVDSVWMAGIGEREVHRVARLADGLRVMAVIALGRARRRASVWDGLTQRVISGKRRPLASMVSLDRFGNPLPLDGPDPVRRKEMVEHMGGPWSVPPMDVRVPGPTAVFAGAPDPRQIRTLLDAARWAPNAENAQIGRWIVVSDPRRQEEVLSASGVGAASDAGEFVLVAGCAAPFFISRRTSQQPFSLIDVPIAALHQIVVADAMGHGYNMLVDLDHDGARRALSVPADHEVVCLMMFGLAGSGGGMPAWQQIRKKSQEGS